MKKILMIVSLALLTLSAQAGQKPWDNGKLRVSDNQRYLQFENGKPFFWLGDTGWLLPERLDRAEAEWYLQSCAKAGYNVVQVQTIDGVFAPSAFSKAAVIKAELTDGEDVAAGVKGLDINVSKAVFHRTVAAGQYATVILPFAAELPEDVKAYELSAQSTSGSDNVLIFKEVESFEANRPYLVKAESALDEITAENVSVSFAPAPAATEGYQLQGTYQNVADVTGYVLKADATDATFYKSSGANVPAFHCYLTATTPARSIKVMFDSTTTGIHEATADELHQILGTYSLDGRQLKQGAISLQPGIYVIDGRKVIVR